MRAIWILPALIAAPALWLAATAPADEARRAAAGLPALKPMTPEIHARLVAEHRASEVEWRRETRRNYVADLWSRGDDLANREKAWARNAAGRYGVSLEDVVGAADDDLHEDIAQAAARGSVAPCMPRPFYD